MEQPTEEGAPIPPAESAKRNITLDDVAKAAGVSRSTVSHALNRHPRAAPETVAKVEKVAERLGYVPDPALRRLASMRWERSARGPEHASVAFVSALFETQQPSASQGFLEGAQSQAASLGYHFEDVIVNSRREMKTAARILHARGIQAVVVHTYDESVATLLHEDFCPVFIGHSPIRGGIEVRFDRYSIVEDAWTRLRRAGCRSIGAVFHGLGIHSDWLGRSALENCQRKSGGEPVAPIYLDDPDWEEQVRMRCRDSEPDGWIAVDNRVAEIIREASNGTPRILTLHHSGAGCPWPGYSVRHPDLGALALDVLDSEIRRRSGAGMLRQCNVLLFPPFREAEPDSVASRQS